MGDIIAKYAPGQLAAPMVPALARALGIQLPTPMALNVDYTTQQARVYDRQRMLESRMKKLLKVRAYQDGLWRCATMEFFSFMSVQGNGLFDKHRYPAINWFHSLNINHAREAPKCRLRGSSLAALTNQP